MLIPQNHFIGDYGDVAAIEGDKMQAKERLKRLEKEIEEMKNEDCPVVVEGEKDEKSLRDMNCRGEIIKLNQGIPIFALCEEISKSHKKVILLPDWDRKGSQISKLLEEGLRANGVNFDTKHKRRIAFLAKDIKEVECLAVYLSKLKEEADHSNSIL